MLSLLHLTVSFPTFRLLHHVIRKCAHVTEYTLLSMLLYHSLNGNSEWRRRTALWTILITAGYSLSDEFHQTFVPGRGPSLLDSGIDTVGACLGILVVYGAGRMFGKSPVALETPVETVTEK